MLTDLKFEFRPYQCPFRQPLLTHHGLWSVRKGILIRLTDTHSGLHRYGEIAPIPWFGSETLEQALEWCRQLPEQISVTHLFGIPDTLPACQFGFESAGLALQDPDGFHKDLSDLAFCGLLPAGEAALTEAGSLYEQGYRVLKWKIGVGEWQREWQVFTELINLIQQWPQDCRLRLDANGGLTDREAREWLTLCDQVNHHSPGRIEFLEQPLSPHHPTELLQLSQDYQTPIALDESVAQLSQFRALRRWPGILVVKPSLIGSRRAVQAEIDQHPGQDLVFSSALETLIGTWQGITLAGSLQAKTACPRALGWGVGSFFPTGDPLTLLRASAEERETLLQEVWDFYG
ncbi:o-succinylbenzoate synthase [Thermostichus vulcanus]|uniref:o-succinylbenzoate synthase n=1 Tax=Thermostichus vulcanus str. 'Rupite' TaxID=2813851 RepID=A0ABT0CEE8_THEVL|nr:o-succinylbenzoate synthase [Thermostichus vulcanus]MCJ2544159.1 o-succinylbenzoate synthase [Thermostichus vulcanus str. 'Rupite']